MRTGGPAVSVLGWLSRLPLLDRLELAALSGWSRSAVYRAVEALERERLVQPVAHASELIAPTRRYTLSAAGLHRLAAAEGAAVERLMRERPVSEQARRLCLGRIDALAVFYRLSCAVADCSHPVEARCYRALPLDLCLRLADGRTIVLVRLGRVNERRSLAKRLARLRDGPKFAATLLLAPDEVRLRDAARRLRTMPRPCFLALEPHAARGDPDAGIWRTPSGSPALSLREALDITSRHQPSKPWPSERPLLRVSEPVDEGSGGMRTDWTPAARLGPSEKRLLDLLADWPWLRLDHLAALLGVSRTRLRDLLRRAGESELILRENVSGRTRLALSDRGLTVLARRDRAAVGDLRRRWSSESIAREDCISWRNVGGTRSRQLLRHIDHTESVHGFIAALTERVSEQGWGLIQLDPPHRASRYFRYDGKLHSVQPDAFGLLRSGCRDRPFFLEWERRAIRPSTMAAKLAPYLRYYGTRRPTEDHGAQPLVLIALDDALAADRLLRMVREQPRRTLDELPILITDRRLLQQAGPLGHAWRTAQRSTPGPAFE